VNAKARTKYFSGKELNVVREGVRAVCISTFLLGR
jgi:hypothetical protein